MWKPFKKKKQIILTPEETFGFKLLTAWRRDKNEVAIITKKGPIILNEMSKFYIEVSAKNAVPVKIEVIPDFKKKVLNLVEIIDPNMKNDGPMTKFAGIEVIEHRDISFFEQLKDWDENVEEYATRIKKYKRSAYFITLTCIVLSIVNLYIFITKNDIFRFVNLILSVIGIFIPISMWLSYLKFHNHYKQYKELRGKIFDLVKEK